MKAKLPEHVIIQKTHVIRLRPSTPEEATTWPWPFHGDADDPSWKVRYAPERLTRTDLMELASVYDAYQTLITHPAAGVRGTMRDLHNIFEEWDPADVEVKS